MNYFLYQLRRRRSSSSRNEIETVNARKHLQNLPISKVLTHKLSRIYPWSPISFEILAAAATAGAAPVLRHEWVSFFPFSSKEKSLRK